MGFVNQCVVALLPGGPPLYGRGDVSGPGGDAMSHADARICAQHISKDFRNVKHKSGMFTREESLVTKRHYWRMGLACTLLFWAAAPGVGEAAAVGSSSPIFSDTFSAGTLAPFVANNGMSAGGVWSVAQGGLVASDYGLSSHLPYQIASVPHLGKNVVVTTSFTINRLDPQQSYRIGVFGRGSDPTTGSSQWDVVFRDGALSLINQGLGIPTQTPFPVQAGQSYNMVAVIDGTWVGAQVWPAGTTQPAQWTIQDTFASTGNFTGVGVAAGNADVTFHNFSVYDAPPTLTVAPTQASAVYQSGQAMTYKARLVANAGAEGGQYDVHYVLRRLDGSAVGRGTVPLQLPSGGTAEAAIALPAQPNGYYRATFSLSQPGSPGASTAPEQPRVVETSTTGMAIVPPQPDVATMDPTSPFGINGPGTDSKPISRSMEQRWTRVYRLFKQQGIQWARTQFLWGNIEPTPGNYAWASADGLVQAAHTAHENLLGLVDYAAPYANPFGSGAQVSFPTFVQEYDQYIQALVVRYMPGGILAQQMGWKNYGISAWEIWNEPSNPQYWQSQDPAQYAELVQSATAAVKAVDPSATVLAYNWQEPTLVQAAGPGSFTGVSIHVYPGQPSQPAFYQTIVDLRQFLTQNGIGSDPIWMTETGWSIHHVSRTEQAEYLQRAAIQSLAASLNKFFMFAWSDPVAGYGELNRALLPMPAFPAMAAVTDELNGYKPVPGLNPVSMGAAVRAYVFQSGTQSLVAVWSPTAQENLTLNSGAVVSADDWMGNPILETGNALTVPLDAQPVFLKADMPAQQLIALIQNGTISPMPVLSQADLSVTTAATPGKAGTGPRATVNSILFAASAIDAVKSGDTITISQSRGDNTASLATFSGGRIHITIGTNGLGFSLATNNAQLLEQVREALHRDSLTTVRTVLAKGASGAAKATVAGSATFSGSTPGVSAVDTVTVQTGSTYRATLAVTVMSGRTMVGTAPVPVAAGETAADVARGIAAALSSAPFATDFFVANPGSGIVTLTQLKPSTETIGVTVSG